MAEDIRMDSDCHFHRSVLVVDILGDNMRESDITPEVIELAKEIAEIWRMEIYVGCWIIHKDGGIPHLVSTGVQFYENEHQISIPSISDCLEKLRELDIEPDISIDANGNTYLKYDDPLKMYLYDSCHEALLSALLEVLKK